MFGRVTSKQAISFAQFTFLITMELFSRTNLKADPAKIKQVKTWTAEILNLAEQVTISLNQLTCRESDCPPVETVIVNTDKGLSRMHVLPLRPSATRASSVIMERVSRQYKIHKSITEIDESDIYQLKAK